MNLPNKLSCLRVLLIPFILGFAYAADYVAYKGLWFLATVFMLLAAIIFAAASYTDYLDGHLARKYNIVSNFGKFVDPLADKLLVLSTLMMFVEFGYISAWIPIVTLFRELVVTGIRLVALEAGGKVVAANLWGKLKTVTQMAVIVFCFLYAIIVFTQAPVGVITALHKGVISTVLEADHTYYLLNNVHIALNFVAWISVAIALFSGFTYWLSNRKILKSA